MNYTIKWSHSTQTIYANFTYSIDGVQSTIRLNESASNGCFNSANGEPLFQLQQGFYFVRRAKLGLWPIFLEPAAGRNRTIVAAATAYGTGAVFTIQSGSPIVAKTAGVLVVSENLLNTFTAILDRIEGLLKLQVLECTVPDHMKQSAMSLDLRPCAVRWKGR
jgi:hypothetical protein